LPLVNINPGGLAEVKVGETISLECVAEGDPMPSLHWERMGKRTMPETVEIIPDESNTGSVVFRIMHASMDDAGTYVCKASSPAGQVEERIVLNVIEDIEFGPPEIRIVPEALTLVEGDFAQITCDSPGNILDFTVTWRRDGQELPPQHSVENGVLFIPSVSSDDEGRYYCVASNVFGTSRVATTVVVQSRPRVTTSPSSVTVQPGQIVKVQCIVEGGTSPITIEWDRVGGQLPLTASDSHGVLQIAAASPIDAGNYKCIASNAAGTVEAVASIYVEVSPTVQVTPPKETKAVGSSVEFLCSATGNPPAKVEWSKEGGRLPNRHAVQNGVLRIDNLQKEDAGRYQCTATNSLGYADGYAALSIQALPKVQINIRTRIQTVPINEAVTFDCQATGEPKPIVRWSKLDGDLPSSVIITGGVLKIRNVRTSDAGTYKCTATNVAGSVNSQVVLYVQAAPQVTVTPEVRTTAVGSSARFTCLATGLPAPDIYWYKIAGDLPLNHRVEHGVLHIPQVARGDAGSYVCRASNRQGHVEFTARLNVGGMTFKMMYYQMIHH
ncbi:basement membrane-specific heparan sulfate proteoglycan core protein-like, partial [Saccoglossus kowalevskii]|uniref:Basement membrane-specific heparan sulfate proteoglycan core protein-like n=1 Tax=Saccoglossus kowalevskii TaxID=10224 RepID=A0ABM0MF84_SACKO